MFVTISVLIDEVDIVKELVYNAALCPVKIETYLENRRSVPARYAHTPVRVIITKVGSNDIHVVEFTGCHYCVVVKPNDAGRCWWANTGCMPEMIVPHQSGDAVVAYVYEPFISVPDIRPLTETESLLHDYALTLANDYFNDRFHLADQKKE